MIDLIKHPHDDVLEVSLAGRLDAHNASHVESELEEIIRGGEHAIILDLTEVPYVSSAGLTVLLQAYQRLSALGGSLAIVRASPQVTSVLRLTGLDAMLTGTPAAATPTKVEAPRSHQVIDLTLIEYPDEPQQPLACRIIGDPARLATGFDAADVTPVSLPPETLALGLGAMGEDFVDCQERFGELLAVAGCAAYLPGDGSKVADFLVATGALIPQVQALYAVLLQGKLHRCLRFESEETPIAISRLVRAALELTGGGPVAFVIAAESAGLVGAALRRSPASGALSFTHPDVRQWLALTPERAFDRSLAVVVGVAGSHHEGPLGSILRPLREGSSVAAHMHAAAVTFRALPKGRLDLAETIVPMFTEQKLLGILHLLDDSREITGAGESHLLRGALWLAPVTPPPSAAGTPREEVPL